MSVYPEHLKQERMNEDAAMLQNVSRWPNDPICMKTQPWTRTVGEAPYFGFVSSGEPLVVFNDEGDRAVYSTIEELVEVWSVD